MYVQESVIQLQAKKSELSDMIKSLQDSEYGKRI